MQQQHGDADSASVEGLPPYIKDDSKSPVVVQEKWADIEATLPPYEPPKTRAKRRLFGRKDWVRIATVLFAVFLCIIVPAVVVGVVFGLRSPASPSSSQQASSAPVGTMQESASTSSDPVYIATDQDGNPLFGAPGTATVAVPSTSETRPATFLPQPSPQPSDITPAVVDVQAVTALGRF